MLIKPILALSLATLALAAPAIQPRQAGPPGAAGPADVLGTSCFSPRPFVKS